MWNLRGTTQAFSSWCLGPPSLSCQHGARLQECFPKGHMRPPCQGWGKGRAPRLLLRRTLTLHSVAPRVEEPVLWLLCIAILSQLNRPSKRLDEAAEVPVRLSPALLVRLRPLDGAAVASSTSRATAAVEPRHVQRPVAPILASAVACLCLCPELVPRTHSRHTSRYTHTDHRGVESPAHTTRPGPVEKRRSRSGVSMKGQLGQSPLLHGWLLE